MKVLVLMAGSSQVFKESGYPFPKPLIEVAGKPVVEHLLGTLKPLISGGAKLVFLIRSDENVQWHVGAVIKLLVPVAEIVEVRGETSGAACSVLLAVDLINNDEPILVVNGDQLIHADLSKVVRDFQARDLDGGIVVFRDVHPRWSFVKCGADGLVIETAEKRPISNLATAGCYYFKRGQDFVAGAQASILKNAEVKGLFYVCPVYNELILDGRKIGTHEIPKSSYVSLATPRGLEAWERGMSGDAAL